MHDQKKISHGMVENSSWLHQNQNSAWSKNKKLPGQKNRSRLGKKINREVKK